MKSEHRPSKELPDHTPARTALLGACFSLMVLLAGAPVLAAELAVVSSFNPSMTGSLCSLAVDPATGNIWVYQCGGAEIESYSSAGTFLDSVARPGEKANDVDLDFSLASLNLDGTALPTGTLLFFNGESGPAEVYALDKQTGNVLATLDADFGAGHVVGGAHHPGRDSLFLVQDRVALASVRNRISEIDPLTGAASNTFPIASVFDVNYGDIDVCPSTGNLFLVSSIENRIAELTPTGSLVEYHALPSGVTSLSGIAIGPGTGSVLVGGVNGLVWQLSGLPCAVETTPVPGECQDDLGNGVICLLDGQFQMEVTWRNPSSGNALEAVNLLRFSDTAAEGYFANPGNVEILAKVIDGCSLNDNFWVFVGGVTDQNVIVDVIDRATGFSRRYENPKGVPYQTIADTGAFPTCP